MKAILKNAMILTAITLISGLCLGLVYEITKEPIAQAKAAAKNEAYKEVLPAADSFEVYEAFDEKKAAAVVSDAKISKCTIDEAVVGTKSGSPVGYVVTVTDGEGYGGDIQFSVGFDENGTVKGISFLTIAESPGLGMQAQDDPTWKEQFFDKEVESYKVVKSGASADGEINALSGATISSKAITNGVNAAKAYYDAELGGGQNE